MASTALDSELQSIREQLHLQADAISRLAEVVSGIDGVDAALLGSYVMQLKKVQPAIEPPTSEAPPPSPGASELDSSHSATQ